jgi:hypothetical protein
MFCLGSALGDPGLDHLAKWPFVTLPATAPHLAGPWTKRPDLPALMLKEGTWLSLSASPGHVLKAGEEFLWSHRVIGMPTVIQVANRLAIFYDGEEPGSSARDIGIARLDLPIRLPTVP